MNRLLLLVATCGSLLTSPLLAEESSEAPPQGLETTALVGVLDEVRGRIGREFVIDARVDDRVVTGQLDAADIDYHRLLVILRNNGLAAVEVGDITTIVPVEIVRQFPLPMLSEDDASVDDEEWITIVLKVNNANAAQLVPLVRPLMPREGHIAAHPDSGTITMVDRAGNARRIAALIRKLDYETSQ